jgi:uncharacterized cupin superfamily protein
VNSAAKGQAHWDQVECRRVAVGDAAATWTDLGKAGGSVATGLKRVQIEPGKRSTPVHVHDAEEEIFYVMAGTGLSWQDGKTCHIAAGDCIVDVAGGPAHTLIAGAHGLDVLVFGTRRPSPTARLPRAGVAWLGRTWIELGREPHPWAREAGAGEFVVPEPGERPGNVVAVDVVDEWEMAHGDVASRWRGLGRAAGACAIGLNHVSVASSRLGCPPHVHSAEEEIFVVLQGAGQLLLYEPARAVDAPLEYPVLPGSVVVRVSGSGVPHAFRAGDAGLVLLAFGERLGNDATYYPRSRKLRWRGLGVTGRIELCGYWDGEDFPA